MEGYVTMDTDINETSEVKNTKKGGKAGKIIAGILLGGCLVASLGLNIYQAVVPNQKTADFIDYILERIAEEEKKENEYIEDGYKVGGEYEIRSTTHISDAYKSGDDGQLSEEDKETLKMAKDVLDEVIEDGMSDYEKELAVYQWMVKNIGHGSGGVISRPGMRRSPFTPHDVLIDKDAVCVGYATTFRLFMNMLGMDCHIVHNDYHSWDLVQLDGDWYHVDVYSDSHGGMYSNFNMTDEICSMGHNWDESALPEANSVKYSPAVQNGIEVDDVYAVPAALKTVLDDGVDGAVFFKFKTPLNEEDTAVANFLVSGLTDVLGGMLEDVSYWTRAYWYFDEQDNYILGLLMEKEGGEDEPSVIDSKSPEGRKIIEAIAAAFELDPAMLGGGEDGDDPEWEEFPAENAIGGADGSAGVAVENAEAVTAD